MTIKKEVLGEVLRPYNKDTKVTEMRVKDAIDLTLAKVKRDLIKITKPRTVHATCGAYESYVTSMLKKYIAELDEAKEKEGLM